MNTSVLRIGNHVLHAGKVIAVTSVFPKGINARTDPSTGRISYIRASEIEPIPVSTDMLRRLGFRQTNTRWMVPNIRELYVDRAVDKFRISVGHLGSSVCRVYFVHQLQNLFTDGWGVELKLRK